MKEKLVDAVGNKLDNLEVFIDSVNLVNQDNEKVLEVILDSKNMIDLKTVVKATRIINPIVDKIGLSDDIDTLDVYAKEKGDVVSE